MPERSKSKPAVRARKASTQPRRAKATKTSEPAPTPPEIDPDTPPGTPDELRAWLAGVLGLTFTHAPLTEGHSVPFDYLKHAFFEDATPRDCVVWANRGGGKTFLGAVATMLDLVFKPGIEVRILGGSYEQSRRMHAHLRRLFDARKRPALAALVEGRLGEGRIVMKNGATAELLAQSQTSVRGTRVQKIRCDEADLFKRDVWEAAQLATRSARCGPFMVRGAIECLSTMHRPYGVMYDVVGECAQGARRLFRWGVADCLGRCPPERDCASCPLWRECGGRAKDHARIPGHISIEDAAALKARVGLAQWETEMLCLRPTRADSVLPEFSEAAHVYDGDGVPYGAVIGGMDFGNRNPTVVLLAALGNDGVLRVFAEYSRAGVTMAEHATAILAGLGGGWPIPAWIGADPAGKAEEITSGTSCVRILEERGVKVLTKASKIRDGLGLLRARLKPADASPPRLLVHRRCAGLIHALLTHHYPEDQPQSEKPVKDGSDHAVDALRYMVLHLDGGAQTRFGRYA